MPITSITIENFKGIAEPITIPIRPITLLFGKNSAGKSTILQSLMYVWEVLENKEHNLSHTQTIEDSIDLGGFRNLVYQHDLTKQIRIRIEFSIDDDGIPKNRIQWDDESKELPLDLNEVVSLEKAWIEIVVAWDYAEEINDNNTKSDSYIAEYAVGINGEEFTRLESEQSSSAPTISDVNIAHEIIRELDRKLGERQVIVGREYPASDSPLLKPMTEIWKNYTEKGYEQLFSFQDTGSILPDLYQPFSITEPNIAAADQLNLTFWGVISQALTGPLSLLLNELRGIRYLGPIREVPSRSFLASPQPNEPGWFNGLGAWDALRRSSDLIDATNHCLQEILQIKYSLRQEERIALDANSEIMGALRIMASQFDETTVAFLRSRILAPLEATSRHISIQLHDEVNQVDVAPSDIGVGISQVIPVIVGALAPTRYTQAVNIFAVEQPELHVHPAVQARLGDVFISVIKKTERTLFIETHSEHLILRLLRRIREFTDGEEASPELSLTIDMLSVIYVESTYKGLQLTVLPVTEDGDFSSQWPEGFFEERSEELF